MDQKVGKFIGGLVESDYLHILLCVSAVFMAISLILRMCNRQKIAIDFTLIAVISACIALIIKILNFEVKLPGIVKAIFLIAVIIISVYIFIDNAAASVIAYDKPRDKIKNLLWCIFFYIIISLLFFF